LLYRFGVTSTLRIPERFCGPPGAANGGYLAGRLAEIVVGAVEVTFRRATPLERDVTVRPVPGGVNLHYDGTLVAEARALTFELEPPAVTLEEALEATVAFPRGVDHPVPRCFVCGTERQPGDGLRIFPGTVSGREHIYAAPWAPDASLADEAGFVHSEFLWAALDCTGAFAVNEPPRGLALLGKLAAKIDGPARVGDPLVVVGWPISRDGRKLEAGTALLTAAGETLAVARATWVLTSVASPR
jgi:acyl-coenzyme A thioesterase PaaI-like protein